MISLRAPDTEPALRRLTLTHALSGAVKSVEYLGMRGLPLRAHIHWPIAGSYFIAPRTGTLIGSGPEASRLRHWRLSEEDWLFVKGEYRRAVERVAPPPLRGLSKCR